MTATTEFTRNESAPVIGQPSRDLPIWLDRVSKWYGPVIGVNEVSLRVESGIVGLLGPNGAGKSTLIKLLTGQLRPSIGHVRVFGRSIRSPDAKRQLGYCPDVDAFYEEMTGRQFVVAMARLCGYTAPEASDRAERALSIAGMNDGQTERQADKRLRGCSKGMRQRIKLAQALVHDPDLLVLDEPLSGLDPVGRAEFCDLFRNLAKTGKTLLISSHVLHEVEAFADRVLLVSEGRLLIDGDRSTVERFLGDQPRVVEIECPNARALAARLMLWPATLEARVVAGGLLAITTRDPIGLASQISRLVLDEHFEVQAIYQSSHWTQALFRAEA